MKVLTKDNFSEEISNGVVLVDMYADWCGPCKALTPILEELSSSRNDVTFAKLDVDANQEIAMNYGVMSIPCVIIFKNGQEVGRVIGLNMKDVYEKEIQKAFR
jgi:thioredoxin 1